MTEQHLDKNQHAPDIPTVRKELRPYKGTHQLDILRLGEEIGTIYCEFRMTRNDGTETVNLTLTPFDVTIFKSDHNSLTITDARATLFATGENAIWISDAVNARLNEQEAESVSRKKVRRR